MRRYSFIEIDQMRNVVRNIIALDRGYQSLDAVSLASVEDQLRTYMSNGTEPQELVDHLTSLQDECPAAIVRAA